MMVIHSYAVCDFSLLPYFISPPSFSPIGIINCLDDPCGENAMCRNVYDSYECYCNTGYQLVNESSCESESHNLALVVCSNLFGVSF